MIAPVCLTYLKSETILKRIAPALRNHKQHAQNSREPSGCNNGNNGNNPRQRQD
jgi:hypothetical protein